MVTAFKSLSRYQFVLTEVIRIFTQFFQKNATYFHKGKDHSITCHEGTEGEQRYSSALSLTSALVGVGGQHHAPAFLTPGNTRYPLYRRLGGSQGRSGRVRTISRPIGVRTPNRPARSEALYWLRYPGSAFISMSFPIHYSLNIASFSAV